MDKIMSSKSNYNCIGFEKNVIILLTNVSDLKSSIDTGISNTLIVTSSFYIIQLAKF